MNTCNEYRIYQGFTFLGFGYGRDAEEALQGWYRADRAEAVQ